MPLPVGLDVSADPRDVGFFGATAVVLDVQDFANAVAEPVRRPIGEQSHRFASHGPHGHQIDLPTKTLAE
jgi:hypothetical protein